MEAVAAVGVASAAVQFLDFSVKTLAACKEIRDSATGSTKANEELTRSVKQLKSMQRTLEQSTHTLSNTYRQLVRAMQDCSRVADDLLQLLEHIREVAQKSLGTMRSALRQVREGKRIEKLQTRLSNCQDRLHLALTAEMRDSLLKKMEEQGQNADSMRSIILQKLDFTNDQIRTLDKNISQIGVAARKQISELDSRQQKASANLRRGQRDLSRNIDSQFVKLSISSTHQSFLDSLYFPEMFARQESMKKNLPGTYDWVFEGKLPPSDGKANKDDEELRGRVVHWLRATNGASVFWISGKPGSGKSSLMSFIINDKRTSKSLQTWSDGRIPYIFSYFFWKPGSGLQKTMTGLRRSLIWQLCKARPSVIDHLLSQDLTLLYSPWTEAKLTDTLTLALSEFRDEAIFFAIDGLDECETNHNDLLDELQGLNSNPKTKVCISSRPEQPFCRRLGALPSVRLQDLNYRDISKYAHTKLERGDNRTKRLAPQVALKAEGVFLWAVLVCDSLCSGIMAEDDEKTILQRLHAYPKGLDDLFDRMFANLEDVHYKSLAFYFYAAQQRGFTVALAVASQPSETIRSLQQFGAMCELEVTRITQQSKGLLQIGPSVRDDGHYTCAWSLTDVLTGQPTPLSLHATNFRLAKQHLHLHIEFVHRSAYDYIVEATSAHRLVWLEFPRGEIIRKVFTGALWLAHYGPILHMASGQLRTTNGLGWTLRLAIPAEDIVKVDQHWFGDELEWLLDSLHSWMSAIKDGNQASQQANGLETRRYYPEDPQSPLRLFWDDILQISPDFVASHSHRLWDRDDTWLNVAALCDSWSWARFKKTHYRRDVDSAMFLVATEFRRRGFPRTELALSERQRRHYSMMVNHHDSYRDRGNFIAWEALHTCDEASYVLKLRRTAGQIALDDTEYHPYGTKTGNFPPDEPSDGDKCMEIAILEAFCKLIQGWRMFDVKSSPYELLTVRRQDLGSAAARLQPGAEGSH
jgi:hypothetical protein